MHWTDGLVAMEIRKRKEKSMRNLQTILEINGQLGDTLSAQRAMQIVALFQQAGGGDLEAENLATAQGQELFRDLIHEARKLYSKDYPMPMLKHDLERAVQQWNINPDAKIACDCGTKCRVRDLRITYLPKKVPYKLFCPLDLCGHVFVGGGQPIDPALIRVENRQPVGNSR